MRTWGDAVFARLNAGNGNGQVGDMTDKRRLGSSYVIEQLLGTGASGQVWSGRDDAGHPWAFKVLRSELAADPGIVNRFVQERSVLASIQHPNVVAVHDLVVEGQTLAIVMDLVEGQDLRSTIRAEGTLAPQTVATYGAQIAAALQAAHHSGVVHRDVKPENVLIDAASGEARLTDFGIARLVDGSHRSTMLLGTPQYMAPEVAEGKNPTPAVDAYSLGIMLYELCCGVPPFAGRGSAMATLRAHAVDVPGRPDGVPDRLWEIISALTAKDPARRPAAGVAAGDLSAVAGALTGVAKAPRLSEPPPPQASNQFSANPHADAATILGSAVAGPPAAGDTVFVDRGAAPGWNQTGPGGPAYPAGYVHPAGYPSGGYPSGGYPSGGYPNAGYPGGGYPAQDAGYSGGYPSGGYPAAQPSPQQPRKRTGALVGAVVGVLLVAAVGLGWLVFTRSPQSEAATTPGDTTSSSSSTTATGTTSVAPQPQALAPQPPAPRPVTVSPRTPVTPQAPAVPQPAPVQQDAATRQAAADATVRGYLERANSGTMRREEMANHFTPTVQWYNAATRVTRESIWSKIQLDRSKPYTLFDPPTLQQFVPNVSYNGRSADRLDYHVNYTRYDVQGRVTGTGSVIVCYVLVPDTDGIAKITRVYER